MADDLSRALASTVRQFADANTAKLNAAAASSEVIATVATVTAGGAGDGNAAVAVTWRGVTVPVAGYLAHYTPAVGHLVVCHYIDSQLIIAGRVIGQP